MRQKTSVVVVLLLAGLAVSPTIAPAQDPDLVERGAAVYGSRCVICHGLNGDGKGLTGIIHRAQSSGIVITVYPRDFTAGVFKFRSTPSGSLPLDSDLMKVVTAGISRSGMPSHTDVPEADRRAVIEYIKTFSPKWQRDTPDEPIEIATAPDYVGASDSVTRGNEMWDLMRCAMCHGERGRGDGPSSGALEDSWGERILPFDFTSGPLKGGSSPEDIYRTFVTGLDGTPMPSYQDAIGEQDRWDLVSYCLELMKGIPLDQVAAK
jgi:mono/diheme cytochrome c family protein